MRKLKHANIITHFGTYQRDVNGRPVLYIVMERMARNLKEHFEWFVARIATMKDWAPYLNQLFEGLDYIHKQSIAYIKACLHVFIL